MRTRSFTVVIPTRERSSTLAAAISSALSQDYPDFRVLVCDNASCDNTPEIVNSFDDKRLYYKRSDKRLSMSHNWELALKDIQTDWLTVIGDDDALMPGALERVNRIANEMKTRAIRSQCVYYQWPSYLQKPHGKILIRPFKDTIEKINSRAQLKKVLNGPTTYESLPVLYTGGFIESSLLDEIRNISGGNVFHSQNPDVYTGVLISMLVNEYSYTSFPLAVQGASIHSNGSSRFSKDHKKYGADAPPDKKFGSEENIPFHNRLPLAADGGQIQSIPVIVYEAYLQSIRHLPDEDLLTNDQIQLYKALSMPGIFGEEIKAWAQEFCSSNSLEWPSYLRRILMLSGRSKRFLKSRFLSMKGATSIYGDLENNLEDSSQAALAAYKVIMRC